MNQQNQSVKTSRIKKITFIFMSIWSTIFGACAQSQYTNVDVDGFEQAIKNDSAQILDVRTHEEFAESHIKGAIQVDVFSPNFMADAESKLQKERPVAVYCRSGRRSATAAKQLSAKGYQVINLEGGIMAWIAKRKETVR
ncbi:rhodanese-like domain-containing protein [Hoylesella loescheii]|jgi:rhodanese domain protein|uniref:rhodanese-like domain-containing protein n=1 Tax=Hoylesella loescheii TaxID=840 RepID=UPI0026F2AF77|nr:rhodanese-like domain-containing protein [Hoylesella loescheii]